MISNVLDSPEQIEIGFAVTSIPIFSVSERTSTTTSFEVAVPHPEPVEEYWHRYLLVISPADVLNVELFDPIFTHEPF